MDARIIVLALSVCISTAFTFWFLRRGVPALLGRTSPEVNNFGVLLWCFVAAGTYVVGMAVASTWARSYIRSEMALAKAANGTVFVDGAENDNSTAIIDAIGRVQYIPPHHSSAGNEKNIRIDYGSRSMLLRLGEDSERPGEFWVFWPAFSAGSNEVGRTTSGSLSRQVWKKDKSEHPKR